MPDNITDLSAKNTEDELASGAQVALAEAIANIDGVHGESVAGLLNQYLDATISSRSSHDWDPQGRIDAQISSRSSHGDPDPNGHLDADVSSRSSHNWDPNNTVETNLDQKLSESGGTDTDIRFSMTPERVDAAQRQTYIDNFGSNGFVNSKTAMENISGSPTVMDTVSASATAMDAVSVSNTALDAIWASSTAWDIVKAKSMAVGKFAVGRAGLDGANYTDIDDVASTQAAMDAVSTSQTAMDAVSTSATGMEAVAASQLAMDAVVAATNVALPTVVETETAMNEVSLSDLALDTLWASTAAWDLIKANAMAVGKFAAGRAGLSGYDYADIDAVATSQTAMDAVSTSETAMDAVSSSTLAMDSVDAAEVARNAVTAVEMASAKFLAGRGSLNPELYTDVDSVGEDLDVDDQAVMDAVSASSTAMDAVSASTIATTAVLLSSYFGRIFSEQVGSEEFFDGRTINPNSGNVEGIPYVYSWDGGDSNAEIVFSTNTPSEFDGGRSLYIDSETSTDSNTYANSDESHSDFLLNVSDANNFSVYLYDPDGNDFCIFVDGSKVASGLTPSSWEKHTFDVSSETGEIIIGVGSNNDTTGGEWYFTAPHLE